MPSRSNLTFEAQQPEFLQKLRAQVQGGDPDRHERQVPRAQRAKVNNDEDGPTIVDDAQEELSKDDLEALRAGNDVKGRDAEEAETTHSSNEDKSATRDSVAANQSLGSKQEIAKVGARKKRKAPKLAAGSDDGKDEELVPKTFKKPKQKAKHVVLSFEDNEQG